MTTFVKTMKWIAIAMEGFFAIPLVGGLFIMTHAWTPLVYAFLFHLVIFLLAKKEKEQTNGNALGMVASILGVIPGLGWALHIATAIVLLIECIRVSKKTLYKESE